MRSPMLFIVFSTLVTSVSSHCTSSWLRDVTNTYTFALSAGKPEFFTRAYISLNTSYTDLAYIGFSDWIVTSTFTQVISTDPSRPYVIGTRIVFSNTHHNDTKVTLIETLATKPGDWLFNATGYAYWNLQEQWDPILTECSVNGDEGVNAERRDSRAAIKAPGDAYFDRFSNVNVSVPFNMPCARLEGSAVYTDLQLLYKQTCDLGLPSHVQLTNRRYVVDETMGAVAICGIVIFLGSREGRSPIYIRCRLVLRRGAG
ncbi:hypothetical protein SMACR_12612 [Sordaria macrospora]|uniref:WGS project CABT00000000 data, contig 2.6 n=2 Tax=Sordaria macrospora TaxID=5147 RepID=F7VSL9_SORMK|nr:uncharacterized protein SMAC_12612 [Sordaria macrospora k-hell]KAA8630195.1 hypothetical protein SMACR_12612 [Sordaria macrospora]KAH7626779.1 hypothetical protein B0T09DRAFT_368730 [Sordaria sp. MPI-SDFR-AT-0083]WPJ57687.1 hypothetical protein SMAC4_12612 [Sordaria macrospora]CCC08686.1 unnamed protein product [Sordaria macrospora k-hell]